VKPLSLRLVGDDLYLRAAARDGPLTPQQKFALTGFQAGQIAVLLARFPLDGGLETKARTETVIIVKQIAFDLGFKVKIIKTHSSGWVTVRFRRQ
jgi:hypothetical protein